MGRNTKLPICKFGKGLDIASKGKGEFLLEVIDMLVERLEGCRDLGRWGHIV